MPSPFGLTDAGAPHVFSDLLPGDYSVTEVVPVGWRLQDLSCAVGEVPTGQVADSTVQIALTAGQDVVCTYTNEKLAEVSVTKNVDGTSDDWSFSFTISPDPLIEGQLVHPARHC